MPSGGVTRRPGFWLALGLCAIGGAVTLLGYLAVGPQTAPHRVPLANIAGVESTPAFSPSGQRLAYSARRLGSADSLHIFVRGVPTGAPQQLTPGDSNDVGPAWSPDGASIAFLRLTEEQAQYTIVPAAGGAERQVAEFPAPDQDPQPISAVSWTPDGKTLAVVQNTEDQPPAIALVSIAGGAPRRITEPPAGSPGDSSPAISPAGGVLAFVRHVDQEESNVYLCDLNGGGLRRLTFDGRPVRGIAWTPDGQDILYSANRMGGWKVWRVPAYGGSPRELLLGSSSADWPAVAPQGRRMAYAESPSVEAVWLAELPGGETPRTRPLIRSNGTERGASWSPDGARIADISDQTGADEIWLSDASGGNRVQVTHMQGPRLDRPRWSPDGHWLLFVAHQEGRMSVYRVASDARSGSAKPIRLLAGSTNAAMGPAGRGGLVVVLGSGAVSWSHDGKSMYYESGNAIWKAGIDGGNPRQITHRPGAGSPEESLDGKYVYYRGRRSIWRVPAEGGEEEEYIVPEHELFWTTIQAAAKGVYYLDWDRGRRQQLVEYYDPATHSSSVVFRMKDAEISPRSTFAVSPDGKQILYPKVDRDETNLVLVENFR